MRLFYVFTALLTAASAAYPKGASIDNAVWNDVNGNFIHAHGGQIVEHNNTFYLIGTTQKKGSASLSEGINCYSSPNMVSWTFEREIFHNTSIVSHGSPPWRIERPKVVVNEKYNNFVMWFHLDTSSFGIQSVGVAKSSSICGDYEWVGGFQPDNLASYDMGLYQEGPEAFLVRSVENKFAGISQLTDDYLNTTGLTSKGPKMEGVTIFKLDTYYLLGSHLSGWAPNPAQLCTTKATEPALLKDAVWDNINNDQCPNPTGSGNTYKSQSTFVLRLEDAVNKKYSYVFMADIWDAPNVNTGATYLWLPIVFNSTHPEAFPHIPYMEQWRIGDFEVDMP